MSILTHCPFFIHKKTEAQSQKWLVQDHMALKKGTAPELGSSDHNPSVFSTPAPVPEKQKWGAETEPHRQDPAAMFLRR